MTKIELTWYKISEEGTYLPFYLRKNPQKNPGTGLWHAHFWIPYTDTQGSMEYFAIDGAVRHPIFCLSNQERDAAVKEAQKSFVNLQVEQNV